MHLRQPIVTVCGHVDHGKTSLLDCFRGTSVQAGEAGGITQRISFTKYPREQIEKVCPLIKKAGIILDIPGFLFIDTPGHAAFTNLRKRGGSLADLAILVVSIKEGIKPQTAEVIQILKAHKTPFVIALNKVDSISGWHSQALARESVHQQAPHARQEFDLELAQFQGSLHEHGFESDVYWEIPDFTKKVAIVPCSAKTKEGISELLFVLSGLCQKFLKERLQVSLEAKGVILEVKKEKSQHWAEAILYDGVLKEGDEIIVASFQDPVITKVRALAEILPLSQKYASVREVAAASGVKIQLTESENILPGMPFQQLTGNKEATHAAFKREVTNVLELDRQGIIIKADSLGSLEALLTLLRQEHIQILKAGIGPITKSDLNSAQANLEINPLDAIVIGFNVPIEQDSIMPKGVKILSNTVIYKLIEDLGLWRKEKQDALLKEKLMSLATISKLEILPQYVFRNSNPAIFGVRVLAGKIKVGIPLIDEQGEEVARVKSLQHEKTTVSEATEGQELALALPGIAFDRRLKDVRILYANISASQFKQFKKHKDLLTAKELQVLQEFADLKQKTDSSWVI
ncbi:translation initiation factor IF-2 [Candidatus Pacearchaeota archaeon]|nr:translation initiation factor IF-2 [Candidatus Pacearchaeota archaeon]